VFGAYRQEIELANGVITATGLDAVPALWPDERWPGWKLQDLRAVILHVIAQPIALAHDRAQARVGRPSPGPGRVAFGPGPLVGSAETRPGEASLRTVRSARRLTFREVVSSYY
jgi:hypothetical protein